MKPFGTTQTQQSLMVSFPATDRHGPSVGTKLYCLVTEAHGCQQLAQSCYLAADRPGVKLATSVQH